MNKETFIEAAKSIIEENKVDRKHVVIRVYNGDSLLSSTCIHDKDIGTTRAMLKKACRVNPISGILAGFIAYETNVEGEIEEVIKRIRDGADINKELGNLKRRLVIIAEDMALVQFAAFNEDGTLVKYIAADRYNKEENYSEEELEVLNAQHVISGILPLPDRNKDMLH